MLSGTLRADCDCMHGRKMIDPVFCFNAKLIRAKPRVGAPFGLSVWKPGEKGCSREKSPRSENVGEPFKRQFLINHDCTLLCMRFIILRKAIGNYCFVLLTNRASPQISDIRPDMRQRALFVTSKAAWHRKKMLLARENVDSPLAAMIVATVHNARRASGCQPPSVDNGTGSRLNPARCVSNFDKIHVHCEEDVLRILPLRRHIFVADICTRFELGNLAVEL